MQTSAPVFIGYGRLEEWAQAVDLERPVYATLLEEPGKSGLHGHRIHSLVIVCAQPDMDDHIHYTRIPVALLQYIGSTSFTPDHKERRERARQARTIVEAWLLEQGLQLRNAAIAPPQSLRLTDGWADFLGYDKKAGGYFRKDISRANLQQAEKSISTEN